jgi:hypothetical protein
MSDYSPSAYLLRQIALDADGNPSSNITLDSSEDAATQAHIDAIAMNAVMDQMRKHMNVANPEPPGPLTPPLYSAVPPGLPCARRGQSRDSGSEVPNGAAISRTAIASRLFYRLRSSSFGGRAGAAERLAGAPSVLPTPVSVAPSIGS